MSSLFSPFSHMSDLFGSPPDMTTIRIRDDGTVVRYRTGAKSETRLLSDISNLPPSVVAALTEFRDLADKISDKDGEAKTLDRNANQLEVEINRRRIELRFAISDTLPDGHTDLFGNPNLRLHGDELVPINVSVPGYDYTTQFEIEESVGRALLDEQIKLDDHDKRVSAMRNHAKKLQREANTLPDLLKVKKEKARYEFDKHVVPLLLDDDVLEISAGFNTDGKPAAIILRAIIKEEGSEIPDEERNAFAALIKLWESRDGNIQLPTALREALDMTPQIEESTDTEQPADESETVAKT